MVVFEVPDISCNHCVKAITEAVKAVDAGAEVNVDLPAHRVSVEAAGASVEALKAAIEEAGYTATQAAG
ncbi:heavy-metal-associated domain-containing protein [Quisquiliibacterium transsilvanicum]|jgi:copper chaperone|uniref:Copper chaperone n=1 Tax=Quisquiliibacterium transsilvanicum TaxID=1549638 RepID=A0A7W8HIS1_9BURK|nr:heavy-metal-associated domain-containing protein [Quisquiliibacterium transsilvanicum]MBB5272688.1 copper chaperone [Quisquiliibacterium transsilvanicum]